MGETNKDLVTQLKLQGVLKTPHIIDAFEYIKRADFVLKEHKPDAYTDTALPIGYGQTISQPYTVAYMLESLSPQEGNRALDIGSGSGWTTALLADIVGDEGYVYGVERIPELVQYGNANIAKFKLNNAEIVPAGEEIGLREHAPYDRILVSAAAERVPESLLEQLAIGGVLVLPVKDALWRIEKNDTGGYKIEKHEGFAFVPLVSNQ